MHGTDPDTRTAYISALRDLADYLTANPALPVPQYGTCATVHADSIGHGGCVQVDRIAAQLGTPVEDNLASTGYYQAKRYFGPIEYVAWAVSDATLARHRASQSYWGCVTPDTGSDCPDLGAPQMTAQTAPPNPAADWLLAEYDDIANPFPSLDASAGNWHIVLSRGVHVQPIFTLKSVMDAGQAMRISARDYADPIRRFL